MDIAGDQMDFAWNEINFTGVQKMNLARVSRDFARDQMMQFARIQKVQFARIPLREFARVSEETDGNFSKWILFMTWSLVPS